MEIERSNTIYKYQKYEILKWQKICKNYTLKIIELYREKTQVNGEMQCH